MRGLFSVGIFAVRLPICPSGSVSYCNDVHDSSQQIVFCAVDVLRREIFLPVTAGRHLLSDGNKIAVFDTAILRCPSRLPSVFSCLAGILSTPFGDWLSARRWYYHSGHLRCCQWKNWQDGKFFSMFSPQIPPLEKPSSATADCPDAGGAKLGDIKNEGCNCSVKIRAWRD
jgi:hypothetical protein